MAVFRTISNSFWTDSKVDDTFTPEDKYFYLYLLTNPHTNICGCYEISNKQMSRETGYNEDTIKRLIERFEKVHDVIRYNPDTKEMLILNWHKYNWTKSEKLKTAVEKVIGHIKCQEYAEYIHATLYDDTVSIPYRYGMDTNIVSSPIISNTNTNTKESTTKKSITKNTNNRGNVFIPPTVDEVREYCYQRQNNIDPESFVDFYASKGWMVGKSKMKDWKAAVRTWERNRKGSQQSTGNPYIDMLKEGRF